MDERDVDKDGSSDMNSAQDKQGNNMGFALPNAIGDRLKAYYNDVASEPVPDRFLSLLDRLDQAEEGRSSKQKSGKEGVE